MEKTLLYLTRPSCHLCADALPLVNRLSKRHGFTLEEVNIDLSDKLTMTYGLRIPLLKTADGQVLAEGRIESSALKKELRKAARVMGQPPNSR